MTEKAAKNEYWDKMDEIYNGLGNLDVYFNGKGL